MTQILGPMPGLMKKKKDSARNRNGKKGKSNEKISGSDQPYLLDFVLDWNCSDHCSVVSPQGPYLPWIVFARPVADLGKLWNDAWFGSADDVTARGVVKDDAQIGKMDGCVLR